jgi:hypothetical protein
MGLPVLAKTHQLTTNQSIASAGTTTDAKFLIRTMKDKFKGAALGAWTVVSSSNAVTANTSDHWNANADIVGAAAGVAHSWIVIKQTGIAANFQVLIDITNVSVNQADFYVSPAVGFTGGTTTNAPTASDSSKLFTGITWWNGVSAGNLVYNSDVSTDGTVSRFFVFNANKVAGYFSFSAPQNPVSGWTAPFAMMLFSANGADCLTYNAVNASAPTNMAIRATPVVGPNPTVGLCTVSSEGVAGGTTNTIGQLELVANDASGDFPLVTCGITSVTVGARGRHGNIFDLWWGSTTPVTGDTYPNDATRQFIHLGNIVTPWDGSVPVLA